ncbi:MAG: transporter substrate-binding domain-containing protein [Candidatus Cloacimonadota bacterium]
MGSKVHSFILILILLLGLQLAARTVRVAVYENPPKTSLDENGVGRGIFFDILVEIAQREGWDLTYVPGDWDQSLDRLRSGEIDLMPDLAYNAQRDMLYSFHDEPVLSSWSQIYSAKGLGVKAIPDMDGKRIAVLAGSIQETALQSLTAAFGIKVEIISYESFEQAFQAVAEGEAELAATNMFFGALQSKQMGLEDTAIMFEPSSLFFATKKGENLDLLQAIDRHLIEMKADPESPYYRAIKSWHSEETKFVIPTWIKILALVLGLGLIYGLTAAYVLKKQVRLRTRELEASNREMEGRIILRTAQVEAAMLKAQESDMLKSAFLATMSHELRTPLNSIIGFTGILLQELPGKLNEEQKKQLSMVQKSSRHLLTLINDVLDISKIEAGQLDLAPEAYVLRDSIEKLIGIIQPNAGMKGLELEHHIEPEDIELFTDKRRVEQIILNLLSNAIKFTEQGKISLLCRKEAEKLVVDVKDSGIGISKANIKQLFLPFRQIESGLTRRYEGTGLGLSISQKLAALLGGKIVVTSTEGEGSTFSLIIPLKLERRK